MENYVKQLQEQAEKLETLIHNVDYRIRHSKAPNDKKICVSYRKNGFQYYEIDAQGKRRYIKKKNRDMVRAVVQREYYKELMQVLTSRQSLLSDFLTQYNVNAVEQVYNNLNKGKKALVIPIEPTDEMFIQEWKQMHKGCQNEYPASVTYRTEQGEDVRSKSEKILADLFLKHKIPYRYETRVKAKNGKELYPDFTLLNIRTRKTVYWEHFGLISDGEYATKSFAKLYAYEEIGLDIGKDVLFTVESPDIPLNLSAVEEKIQKYLL